MKLFLDANILFTAAYSPNGISRHLFALSDAGFCSLSTSAFALEEARRNLIMKASGKLPELDRLSTFVQIVPEPSPDKVQAAIELPLPLKDAPVMAAAVSCGADILVTGDRRDFGHLFGREIEGVLVLSPREALDEVMKCE
jgi:predicted nucleic acid-binding protein